MQINYTITNQNEDSNAPRIYIDSTAQITNKDCWDDSKSTTTKICLLQKYLKTNSSVTFELKFNLTNLSGKYLNVNVTVKSSTEDINKADNSMSSIIPLKSHSSISIKG